MMGTISKIELIENGEIEYRVKSHTGFDLAWVSADKIKPLPEER